MATETAPIITETAKLTKEISKQVETYLKNQPQERKIQRSGDIYTAIFKEGAVSREIRFYAPGEDLAIEDAEKRHRDREARIWRLCKRYERFLRSNENRKVNFVGVPQPFVTNLEAKMANFELNASKMYEE